MQNNTLILLFATLLVGVGLGYSLSSGQTPVSEKTIPVGMHAMPDGTFMPNAVSGASMEHSMDAMMAGLEGKTGDEFDKAFLEEMIVHHEGAVEMAEALLKNTKRSELQKLGKDIIIAQTGEIQMMRTWLQEWF